ncbi:MAG TPA: hypothetical protein VFH70_08025 [Acidimicrobiales bacterium]|nr:hypothetical protein [Acidimicrobiales bacterium]
MGSVGVGGRARSAGRTLGRVRESAAARATSSSAFLSGQPLTAETVTSLQRTAGNRAVSELLESASTGSTGSTAIQRSWADDFRSLRERVSDQVEHTAGQVTSAVSNTADRVAAEIDSHPQVVGAIPLVGPAAQAAAAARRGELSQGVDNVVDYGERREQQATAAVANRLSGVPVVGTVARGLEHEVDTAAQAFGGFERAGGHAVTGTLEAAAHPLATAGHVLGNAEHALPIPGLPVNPVRVYDQGLRVLSGHETVGEGLHNLAPDVTAQDDMHFWQHEASGVADEHRRAAAQGHLPDQLGQDAFNVLNTVAGMGETGAPGAAREAEVAADVRALPAGETPRLPAGETPRAPQSAPAVAEEPGIGDRPTVRADTPPTVAPEPGIGDRPTEAAGNPGPGRRRPNWNAPSPPVDTTVAPPSPLPAEVAAEMDHARALARGDVTVPPTQLDPDVAAEINGSLPTAEHPAVTGGPGIVDHEAVGQNSHSGESEADQGAAHSAEEVAPGHQPTPASLLDQALHEAGIDPPPGAHPLDPAEFESPEQALEGALRDSGNSDEAGAHPLDADEFPRTDAPPSLAGWDNPIQAGRLDRSDRLGSAGNFGSIAGGRSAAGVYPIRLPDGTEAVAKLYPSGYDRARIDLEMRNAQAAASTGHAGRVYGIAEGTADGEHLSGFAMDRAEGGFIDSDEEPNPGDTLTNDQMEAAHWRSAVNDETPDRLMQYGRELALRGFGYWDGELQFFVDGQGHIRPMDFQGISRLDEPATLTDNQLDSEAGRIVDRIDAHMRRINAQAEDLRRIAAQNARH